MKRRVFFRNLFHNTGAFALLDVTAPDKLPIGMLSKSQAARLRSKLCGVTDCKCAGSPAGTRGPQSEDAQHVLLGSEEYATWCS